MKFDLTKATRVFLGVILTIFGLNGFLGFLPLPPLEGAALDFVGALAATGYLLPLIKLTEITCGVLLLTNRYVPLALAILTPVLVNVLAFHCFLAPSGLLVPVALVLGTAYLAWKNRSSYAPLFIK